MKHRDADPFGHGEPTIDPNLFIPDPVVGPFGHGGEPTIDPNLFMPDPVVDENGGFDNSPRWDAAAGDWRAGPRTDGNGNQQSRGAPTDACAASAGEYASSTAHGTCEGVPGEGTPAPWQQAEAVQY